MADDFGWLYRAIGDEIRRVRDGLGWTQAELADRAGISRASLSNIEKARQHPPLDAYYRIARALDVPLADLLPPVQGEAPAFGVDLAGLEQLEGRDLETVGEVLQRLMTGDGSER